MRVAQLAYADYLLASILGGGSMSRALALFLGSVILAAHVFAVTLVVNLFPEPLGTISDMNIPGIEECPPDANGHYDAECMTRNDELIGRHLDSIASVPQKGGIGIAESSRVALAVIVAIIAAALIMRTGRVIASIAMSAGYFVLTAVGFFSWIEFFIVVAIGIGVLLLMRNMKIRRWQGSELK